MIYATKPETVERAAVLAIESLVRLNEFCPECRLEENHEPDCMTGWAYRILRDTQHALIDKGAS